MNTLITLNIALSLAMLLLLSYGGYRFLLQRNLLHELHQRLELLDNHVKALSSGAAGVDRRVSRLERQGRDLALQQESLLAQKKKDRPYGEAIQLVHKGADTRQLVDELGLSSSEAELVVMLHGVDKAS